MRDKKPKVQKPKMLDKSSKNATRDKKLKTIIRTVEDEWLSDATEAVEWVITQQMFSSDVLRYRCFQELPDI